MNYTYSKAKKIMKKLFSLIMLFGMSAALAGDMPEQVDVYYDASFSSKEIVGFPVAFLAGLGCIEWGLHIKKQLGWTEKATWLVLCGGFFAPGTILGLGLRIRQYQLRNVPILSLRKDGLWYRRKFVCKWDEVDGMRHVLDPNGSQRYLHVYDRSGKVLVTIALEELDYIYGDLINDLNRFIDASHPEHSRLR